MLSNRPHKKRENQSNFQSQLVIFICCIAMLIALFAFGVLIANAEALVALGLVGQVWYVVVLMLGLGSSAALFFAFKSYATYSGNMMAGKLQLGGPAVLMLIVTWSGFQFAPVPSSQTDFDFTLLLKLSQRAETVGFEDSNLANLGNIPRGREMAIIKV